MQDTISAAAFGAVFAALFTGHSVADHWVQTHTQALAKGGAGAAARRACTAHVTTLTATLAAFLAAAWLVLDLPISLSGTVIGLTVNAVSHWWADRRTGLARLSELIGKGGFYHLGEDTAAIDGGRSFHIGTGAYALDQSWHHAWLFVTALIIATV